MLRNFFAREELAGRVEGQTMVEYALLLALIAVVVAAAIPALSDAIVALFGAIADALTP